MELRICSFGLTALLLGFVLSRGRAAPECSLQESLRFDCLPEPNPSQEKCVARGCCWQVASTDNTIGMSTPSCFYPLNYGYHLKSINSTDDGWRASLEMTSAGPYGSDVKELAVDVVFETPTRLHFKIYDPSTKRYEVPIPTPTAPGTSEPTDYKVVHTEMPFGIAVVRKSTGSIIFNSSVGGFIFEDQFLQLSSLLSSSNLYGLGEHVAPVKLDLNWRLISLMARDRGTPEGEGHNLYGVHPFYINMENDGNANGVFLLNSNPMDIILQPTPAITYRTIGGILDFYVFLGPTPDDVVQQYTEVIGRPFMPPYWALGFHLCRWGYDNATRTAEIVNKMRMMGIPQDVQWNDIDYMDRHLDFTFDQTRYKDLPDLVSSLHQNGQRYIMITDPGISSSQPSGSYPPYDDGIQMDVFIKNATGQPIVGQVWPGKTVFPDFFHPQAQQYWTKQITEFHQKLPFDGLWIDMNEVSNELAGSTLGCPNNGLEHPPYKPSVDGDVLYTKTLCMSAKNYISTQYNLHSLYGYSEMVATMKALETVLGKRSLVISRSTYPNSGQHGGHWLGDNHATWNDLYLSIPGMLNFNLFGIPMVGADICGFGGNTTPELCTRWMQLGAFYPFSRNHNSINMKDQDPTSFDEKTANIMKTALLTRYSLLPTLYTLFWQAHAYGSAVARPLFYEFPTDKNTWSIDRQFMWGSQLLVSPVLEQGATSVVAYFPAGLWYDYYTNKVIESPAGGLNQTLQAPLQVISLHIRGGEMLAEQSPSTTTTASRRSTFSVVLALDANGYSSGQLYSDDGESLGAFEASKYTLTNFTASKNSVTSSVVHFGYTPENQGRLSGITVLGVPSRPSSVKVDGGELSKFLYVDQALILEDLYLYTLKPFTVTWE